MTLSLHLSSICNSIAALSISGVTVKDADELAASWQAVPNILYPNINQPGFVTNFSVEYPSVLRGAYAPMDVSYTLNYRFLGTQVGSGADIGTAYGNVVTKMLLITATLLETASPYSGQVLMTLGEVSIGMKEDPAGNQYHGADFALNITENH